MLSHDLASQPGQAVEQLGQADEHAWRQADQTGRSDGSVQAKKGSLTPTALSRSLVVSCLPASGPSSALEASALEAPVSHQPHYSLKGMSCSALRDACHFHG